MHTYTYLRQIDQEYYSRVYSLPMNQQST